MKAFVLAAFSLSALAQVPDSSPMSAEDAVIGNEGFVEDAEPIEVESAPSVDAFEPNLAPYGEWFWLNNVRVFRPSVAVVGADFVPYASHGQWVSTEAGWSFVSRLPFAWATFHYGRWWYDPSYGWVWVPDTMWGPAWVDWRFGGGYAGWAPLPPPVFAPRYRPRWFFVEAPYFSSRELFRYAVPGARFETVIRVTAPVPTRHWRGAVWYAGPSFRDVAHVAVAPPPRRSMRAYVPPPSFHQAAPATGWPVPAAEHRGNGPAPGVFIPPPRPSASAYPSPGYVPPPARASQSPGYGPPSARAPQSPGYVPPPPHAPQLGYGPPPARAPQSPVFVAPPSRGPPPAPTVVPAPRLQQGLPPPAPSSSPNSGPPRPPRVRR